MGCISPSAVSRRRHGLRGAVALLVWALISATASGPALARSKPAPEIKDVEDLQIVDCLLPGKVRRLGRRSQYVTPRRPIRTTAVDCEIRGGDYVAHDPSSYASALELWLPSAKAGDAKAQTYVGEIFEKGLAGSPDHEVAAVWYRRAAEQGFARGQINLANFYEKGLGVSQDSEQALEWYRKAAGITEEMVLDSRAEAEALRKELEDATREAEELETQLGEAERSLETVRSDLEGARSEMEELRRQLEEAKASDAARAAELSAEIERRETEITTRTEEVARRSDDVAGRRQAFEDFRKRVEEVRAAARRGGAGGPSIEIVRPDVLATRGPALVPVPDGVSELTVTGRVDAPAGLTTLTVDDRPLEVDARGIFETAVAFEMARKEVHFEARDAGGRTARATLVLAPATSEAGSGPAGSGPAPVEEPAPSGDRRPKRGTASSAGELEGSVALIIGVTNYSHFPSLETAASDARELAELLAEKYGFETRVLSDPSTLAILLELKTLAESREPEDELLIYYAGHGKLDTENRKGSWIPADAETDDDGKWIANEVISDYLDLIPASHILVVSDSCYSGTMTRSGLAQSPAADHPGRSRMIAGKKSRTVLTSGGLQPVLDSGGGEHSIFARALLTVLKLNDEPLSGVALHREVAARVTWAASALGVEQVPFYAPIRFSGHETGDFVLTPRRTRSSRSQASP